jgi:hypothetical protein
VKEKEEIPMDIREFAEQYIAAQNEAWKNGNYSLLEKLEDPAVVFQQFFIQARQSISHQTLKWEYLVGEGNLFALAYKSTFTVIQEMPGIPIPVGTQASADAMFVLRLQNGKVIEAWENSSTTVK